MKVIDVSNLSSAEFFVCVDKLEEKGVFLHHVECGGDQVNAYFEGVFK